MSKINQPSDNIKERIVKVLNKVTDDNIAEKYAFYSNLLAEEADCGDDEDEYNFLCEITDVLKDFIVQNYMDERGWYQSDLDDLHRWERE